MPFSETKCVKFALPVSLKCDSCFLNRYHFSKTGIILQKQIGIILSIWLRKGEIEVGHEIQKQYHILKKAVSLKKKTGIQQTGVEFQNDR